MGWPWDYTRQGSWVDVKSSLDQWSPDATYGIFSRCVCIRISLCVLACFYGSPTHFNSVQFGTCNRERCRIGLGIIGRRQWTDTKNLIGLLRTTGSYDVAKFATQICLRNTYQHPTFGDLHPNRSCSKTLYVTAVFFPSMPKGSFWRVAKNLLILQHTILSMHTDAFTRMRTYDSFVSF